MCRKILKPRCLRFVQPWRSASAVKGRVIHIGRGDGASIVDDLMGCDEGLSKRARGKRECNVSAELVQAGSTLFFRIGGASQHKLYASIAKCSNVKV